MSENNIDHAHSLDAQDELSSFRERFHLPIDKDGNPIIYFCGNSLGLQPKNTAAEIDTILKNWAVLGVEGHFHGSPSWIDYNTSLKEGLGLIVGGSAAEVAVMNTLSVNLHLLLASFYRPTADRYKILIESDAFPSDKYVVASQAKWHGYDPASAIIEVAPSKGATLITEADIANVLEEHGDSITVVMLGGINYYTGQAFDMARITSMCQSYGCTVGWDLAHAAGNIPLRLHDWNVDFAAWCNYKYLNSGPGAIAGAFIHERHHHHDIPRLEAWWGNHIDSRFIMADKFDPAPGAEAWIMSTPPTIAIAAIKGSLDVYLEAGLERLRRKSILLTGYLEQLIQELNNSNIEIITPADPNQRGCQLSIRVKGADKRIFETIRAHGVELDWREPDVIRVSPAPLYNTFMEVYQFVEILKRVLAK